MDTSSQSASGNTSVLLWVEGRVVGEKLVACLPVQPVGHGLDLFQGVERIVVPPRSTYNRWS